MPQRASGEVRKAAETSKETQRSHPRHLLLGSLMNAKDPEPVLEMRFAYCHNNRLVLPQHRQALGIPLSYYYYFIFSPFLFFFSLCPSLQRHPHFSETNCPQLASPYITEWGPGLINAALLFPSITRFVCTFIPSSLHKGENIHHPYICQLSQGCQHGDSQHDKTVVTLHQRWG